MRTYILKRVLLVPPTMLGITVIVFLLVKLAPGDPAAFAVGAGAGGQAAQAHTAEVIKKWRAQRGLDRPLPVQYWLWLKGIATLDFGRSLTIQGEPEVMGMIWERLPRTIALNIISLFLVYAVAIPIGIVCAAKQHTWVDRGLTSTVFMLYALPTFWVGTMLLLFLANPKYYHWFPTTGYPGVRLNDPDMTLGKFLLTYAKHGVLPVICLTYGGFAFLSRQMRASLLEQIRQDYIRTARAKGLHERVVILKHALRNSLIPILTIFAAVFPIMISGSLIVEVIFNIPGMGLLMFEAISQRDYPIIMGEITIAGFLTLLGILVADILYVIVDPRISFE